MREGGLDDPTAAYDFVAIVEDGRLAGGDGALRSIKRRKNFVLARHFNDGPGWLVAVANLGLDAHGGVERGDGNPVQVAGAECLDGGLRFAAYGDLVRRIVDLDDVERRVRREAESLALSDRKSVV